jgi:hypothetical protein
MIYIFDKHVLFSFSACFTNSFICDDGQCIEPSAECDGIQDCFNGDDEEGCGGRSRFIDNLM